MLRCICARDTHKYLRDEIEDGKEGICKVISTVHCLIAKAGLVLGAAKHHILPVLTRCNSMDGIWNTLIECERVLSTNELGNAKAIVIGLHKEYWHHKYICRIHKFTSYSTNFTHTDCTCTWTVENTNLVAPQMYTLSWPVVPVESCQSCCTP